MSGPPRTRGTGAVFTHGRRYDGAGRAAFERLGGVPHQPRIGAHGVPDLSDDRPDIDGIVPCEIHHEPLQPAGAAEQRDALISLAPLETMTIYFMVCVIAGLVLATLTGLASNALRERRFDLAVVDEATQAVEPRMTAVCA